MNQDQGAVWEISYQTLLESNEEFDETPSEFAVEVASLMRTGGRVLELGCGTGRDAAHFAATGRETLALDHSATAIEIASRQFAVPVGSRRLRFSTHDIAQPLPAADASFDAVYARLSLHYFSDEVTKQVFREIARVLKAGGLLTFMCKSLDDPDYGKGRFIAQHVFESHHVRHFFSEAYARECLAHHFDVISLEHVGGELYGQESAYVKAVASRR